MLLGVSEVLAFVLGVVALVGPVTRAGSGSAAPEPETLSQWSIVRYLEDLFSVCAIFLAILLLSITTCCIRKEDTWFQPIKHWINIGDGILIFVWALNIISSFVVDAPPSGPLFPSLVAMRWTGGGASLISLLCWTIMILKFRAALGPPAKDEPLQSQDGQHCSSPQRGV